MTGWGFWAVAASLAVAVAAVLIRAMQKMPGNDLDGRDADIAVYRDQLAEIERDLARGTLGPEDATRLRAEIGKRVIDADRAQDSGGATGTGPGFGVVVAVILAMVLPGGIALYWGLGAPG